MPDPGYPPVGRDPQRLSGPSSSPGPGQPRLLDRLRTAVRARHYSRRTEKAYAGWVRRYVVFSGLRHPSEMGAEEVTQFLNHLAVKGQVSSSTQNQALSAILFLYREVLKIDLPWMDGIVRARRPRHLPVVLTRVEVCEVFRHLEGVPLMVGCLLYGAGLRLTEALMLRAKDVDFERGDITIRDGKGAKDRVTVLPADVRAPLQAHVERARVLHVQDVASGAGYVELPHAIARKYPAAAREWPWQ